MNRHLIAAISQNTRADDTEYPFGVPSTFAWYGGAVPGSAPPANYSAATGWGQIYPEAGAAPGINANAQVQIKDFTTFLLLKTGKWVEVLSQATDPVIGAHYVADFSSNAPVPWMETTTGAVVTADAPANGYNDHFFPQTFASFAPGTVVGVFVEARMRTTSPTAELVANLGADWWANANAVYPNNSGAAASNWELLTTQWQQFYATSLTVAQLAANPPPLGAVATGDFTGSGTSDLLLADGNALAGWLVQNAAVTQGVNIGSIGTWSLVGVGDFTGNGVDDLLLQSGSSLIEWLMQNGGVSSAAVLTNGGLPAGWTVIGTGNFNGDGTAGILLQNGAQLVDWTIEDGALETGHSIGALPAGWAVIGTGDFNGDGTTDLLLQNGSNLAAWYLQNGNYYGGALITSQLPAGWNIVGTGDFNGDGTTDVLLQYGTQLADWTINNGALLAGYNIGALPTGWSVVDTGDYNGDGTSDLLLQDGTQMAIWTMQNGRAQHGYSEPTLPAGWTIVASKGLVA